VIQRDAHRGLSDLRYVVRSERLFGGGCELETAGASSPKDASRSRALVEGLLHHCRFGLVGLCLLSLQRVRRAGIGRRGWDFSAGGGSVGGLGQTAGTLF